MRVTGFTALTADGSAARGRPLAVLSDWTAADPGTPPDPFQAAQRLRTMLDGLPPTGPVLLALDDLPGIDPESVQAIGWVVRRADADRLLVVATTQPATTRPTATSPARPDPDPAAELLGSGARTRTIELTGLSEADAATLVHRVRPDADPPLVERLWRHTSGNPLHLRGLVTEYTASELARMDPLPAPIDLVRAVTDRLHDLAPDSVALVRAIAVLGPSWSPLTDATELAGPVDPEPALRVLDDAALVETRSSGSGTEIRVRHAVIGAAIVQQTPLAERRALHLAAAELVRSPIEALRHRVAGVDRYDDDLAGELVRQAARAHDAGDHRQAAAFLRWSSGVTRPRDERERRWLDGLFESVLARDLTAVDDQAGEVAWASDAARRALVLGATLMTRQRLAQAAETFAAPTGAELAATDPRTRYRLRVMLGWALVATGGPTARVAELLDAATEEPDPDPAMAGYLRFARGQLRMRTPGQWQRWGMLADSPTGPATPDGPPSVDSYSLAWRGTVFVLAGRLDEGIADLSEFTGRVRDGIADIGDGMFHAILGYGLWLHGSPDRARIPIGLAADSRRAIPRPFVQAVAPLRAIAGGGTDQARRQLIDALVDIRTASMPAALHVAGVVGVVIELLDGSAERQRTLLPGLRRALGNRLVELDGPVSPLWELHLGLSAAWCGEVDLAAAAADRLERGPVELAWRPAGVRWVRGQIALAGGDRDTARRELRRAADENLTGLPVHQEQLAAVVDALDAARAPARSADDPLAVLSDRERDVVALMTEGLSYAQIARELYLSRGTVAFHLSNAYAKTDTANRHELVALVRAGHR